MPSAENTSTATIRPLPGALALGAGVFVGVLAGWGVSVASGRGGETPLAGAAMALAVWMLASLVGFTVLWIASRGRLEHLGMGVLAGSGSRMLAALVLGVTIQVALEPSGAGFWFAFLGAGVGALVGETAWAVVSLQSLRDARAGAAPGATGDTR